MVFVQQDAVDDYLRDFVMDAGIDELCTEEVSKETHRAPCTRNCHYI